MSNYGLACMILDRVKKDFLHGTDITSGSSLKDPEEIASSGTGTPSGNTGVSGDSSGSDDRGSVFPAKDDSGELIKCSTPGIKSLKRDELSQIEIVNQNVGDNIFFKYGKQEFWSGFVGDVYKTGDGLYKMMSVPKNQKERFYKDIFPSNLTQENDTSIVDGFPRNFAAELVWYKQNDGLLDSINAEINKVGGTSVNNIFKNGDSQAEKVTNGIKNTKTPLRDIYDSYGNVLKGDTKFTLKKESGEEENIIIIVFSPLAETLFNMKIECK